MKLLDLPSSVLATFAEQGRGIRATDAGARPEELLELYDMEGCPYCRVVREALTELDLDAHVYPCPKGGTRFRPRMESLGGRQQFPFLVDPNSRTMMYESADIIEYLYRRYGKRAAPARPLVRLVRTPASLGATLLRGGRGVRMRASVEPEQPLELYSFEASPFARQVRERLCELELPYILRQSGRTQTLDWVAPAVRERIVPHYRPEQRNRLALLHETGRVRVPHLVDPNTRTRFYDSAAIIEHLERTYAR
ncbi:glutathione S-transferase N-terminal domain-containing protein [Aquisalimonas sp.]|uniref:glutathione S-transferase N-terminal domain-containing protein n=1 Tax=Aquisalimonas sp. TaxID=1872621 RepID=UPI0025C3E171|nr:glutathione S-transferase N-terminal domain-containing protein [Aquisalimonas sp.]